MCMSLDNQWYTYLQIMKTTNDLIFKRQKFVTIFFKWLMSAPWNWNKLFIDDTKTVTWSLDKTFLWSAKTGYNKRLNM